MKRGCGCRGFPYGRPWPSRVVSVVETKHEWVAWAKGRDIPFAPVNTLPEVLEDAHFRERGMALTDPRGWDHIGNPIRFADEPGCVNFDPPALGQHSQAILRTLGYGDGEIAQLQRDNVFKEATPDDIARHASAGRSAADPSR